jgi:hypothetical protein
MNKKFHLWEFYNSQKVSVDLSEQSRDNFARLVKGNISKIAYKSKITPSRMYDYFINKKTPIPLDKLMNISKLLSINLYDIEKEILSYKQKLVPIKNSIFNPILPLKISPYFTSIVSNLFFDGSLPRDGKGAYYNQKRKTIMDLFTKKLEKVFGDIQFSVKKDHRGVLKCRFPRIAGEISKEIYEVKTFHGDFARLSKRILSLNKENKTAFLTSAILDEGSIAYDGHIIFGVNNKLLCEDMLNLSKDLGLSVSELKNKKHSNFYYFHIKSLKKLLQLVETLSEDFPLISLDYKLERLKKALEIKEQNYKYTKDFSDKRKDMILKELFKKSQTINQLASKLLIPPRTIRRYMYYLIMVNKIERVKLGNEYLYFLKS